jgi:twitching motility protein PilT
MAGVLRGVISQRLLPRIGGGRIPAVEVMVTNARIAELIRERRTEEIPDAIAEGEFFEMQTFSKALIDLVLEELVDLETAANAATNRHDFEIAVNHALKARAAGRPDPSHEDDDDHDPQAPTPQHEPEPEVTVANLRIAR